MRQISPSPQPSPFQGEGAAAPLRGERSAAQPLSPAGRGQGEGRWKPYPAYKDSGVAWLGEVPEGWEVDLVKRNFQIDLGKMLDSNKQPDDGELKSYLRAANIYWEGVWIDDVNQMRFTNQQLSRYSLKIGDLLITEGGVTVGRSAIWQGELEECYYQNSLNRARVKGKAINRFLYYWLYALKLNGFIDLVAEKATFGHLTKEKLENLTMFVPPIAEQIEISAFLDRETAKVDALIARKQRLIELLQEKRTALISQAVTKGLDPSASMKDSGVEWLGEVPEHWEIQRIKFVSNDMIAGPFGSSLTKDMYTNDGYRVYGQEQVIPDDFSIGDYYIPEEKYIAMNQYSIKPGDVLVSCVGTYGKVAVVPENITPGIINPRLVNIRPNNKLIRSNYLGLMLRSQVAFLQMELESHGGTMGIVTLGMLANLQFPVPPLQEQKKIIDYVARHITELSNLQMKIKTAISKLSEYRTAFISAAVTGKIVVRGAIDD